MSEETTPIVEQNTEDLVIDLTDDKEYPNQKHLLRDIAHIYQHLTPENKKIVRFTIARI